MCYENNSVDVLANTISKEAAGSNINVMEAVASVMVNHAMLVQRYDKSKDFQDAIIDACINVDAIQKKELHHHSKHNEISERLNKTCRRIARRALSGNIKDTTNGSLKYHNSSEYPEWAKGILPASCVGNYLFYD